MPKDFTVEPAENHLDKIRYSWMTSQLADLGSKNAVNGQITSEKSINQSINRFILSHTTQYKPQTKCLPGVHTASHTTRLAVGLGGSGPIAKVLTLTPKMASDANPNPNPIPNPNPTNPNP